MIIQQKNIIIGFIVALILLIVLGRFITTAGGFLALITAGILTGYLVNNGIKTGAVHGALIGVFSAIAFIFLLLLIYSGNNEVLGGLILLSVGIIASYIILGIIGGVVGSYIKKKSK